jgi:hypothetical protein
MTIRSMTNADIHDDLSWGDHVIFDVPLEGGMAAVNRRGNDGDHGTGFIYDLYNEYDVPVNEIQAAAEITQIGQHAWTWYDESARVHWHAFYYPSLNRGYFSDGYDKLTTGLDVWWEKWEDEVPILGAKSLILGHGESKAYLGRYNWRPEPGYGALANTEANLRLYFTDGM